MRRDEVKRLGVHLSRITRLVQSFDDSPEWSGLWLTNGFLPNGGRQTLTRASLQDPVEFQETFSQLVDAGHTWINLSAIGVLEDHLVVTVEGVSRTCVPGCTPGVNISGPPRCVRWRDWVLDGLVELTDEE